MTDVEARLKRIEDQLEIYQIVCGYGCAMDGRNAAVVGSFFAEDGVYAVGDVARFEGRAKIEGIAASEQHRAMVEAGAAHLSTLPFVVIAGDRAVATCHTMVAQHGPDGFFIGRLSASRIELERSSAGRWEIELRTNEMLTGSPAGPALLGRLNEAPAAA